MALVGSDPATTTVLVVHDNKREGEPRAGLVAVPADGNAPATYTPLAWPTGAPLPIDLEAVCAVPGTPGEFVALVSSGTAYHVRLDAAAKTLTLVRSFDLPKGPAGSNYEGFALYRPAGEPGALLYAVWAHRGAATEPAMVFTASLDLARGAFGTSAGTMLRTPWPVENSRSASDLKVDAAGNVFVSSASDPGDDGPFSSALYVAGRVIRVRETIPGVTLTFEPNDGAVPLRKFRHHKVEAIELVPGADGSVIFGTDDEAFGASVLRD